MDIKYEVCVVLKPIFSFVCGLRPLKYAVGMLKFDDDVNGYELLDAYKEHYIDKPGVVNEPLLGHEHDEEVQTNDSPNFNDDNV